MKILKLWVPHWVELDQNVFDKAEFDEAPESLTKGMEINFIDFY